MQPKHIRHQIDWLTLHGDHWGIKSNATLVTAVNKLLDAGEGWLAMRLLFGSHISNQMAVLDNQTRITADAERRMCVEMYNFGGLPGKLRKLIADKHEWIDSPKPGWFIQVYAEPDEFLFVGEPHATTLWEAFLKL